MRFLSLFSGIEAASVAWKPLGWECAGVAEIEPFPCKVLKHHYPDVPNLGSVTEITQEQIKQLGHIDLVVGGFPCQDLSVAGKRKGLKNDDGSNTRSGLFYDAMRLVQWSGARYLLLENVPGMFSSNQGKDFASVVGELLGCEFDVPRDGWQNSGVAASEVGLVEWATLDAQFFGVAQRRRRVFIVRDTGDWASRPPIFLERESMFGDFEKGINQRKETPRSVGTGFASGSEQGTVIPHLAARMVAFGEYAVDGTASTCKARDYKDATDLVAYGIPGNWIGRAPENGGNAVEPMLNISPCQTSTDRHGVCYPINTMTCQGRPSDDLNPRMGLGIGEPNDPCPTLTKAHSHAVAVFDQVQITSATNRSRVEYGQPAPTMSKNSNLHAITHSHAVAFGGQMSNPQVDFEINATLQAKNPAAVMIQMQVRRLTPIECERLQGFPDGYTDIQPNGKPTPDGPRYKALGNSMAVPVMRWIGQRIAEVEQIKTNKEAA